MEPVREALKKLNVFAQMPRETVRKARFQKHGLQPQRGYFRCCNDAADLDVRLQAEALD
jgi:hypothetical protein